MLCFVPSPNLYRYRHASADILILRKWRETYGRQYLRWHTRLSFRQSTAMIIVTKRSNHHFSAKGPVYRSWWVSGGHTLSAILLGCAINTDSVFFVRNYSNSQLMFSKMAIHFRHTESCEPCSHHLLPLSWSGYRIYIRKHLRYLPGLPAATWCYCSTIVVPRSNS